MVKEQKRCSIENCNNIYKCKGLCQKHYNRLRSNGDPNIVKVQREHPEMCSIKECNKKYYSKGLCEMHYKRLQVWGDPQKVLIIKDPTRKCIIEGCNKKYFIRGKCENHYKQEKYRNNKSLFGLYNRKVRIKTKLKLLTILGGKCVKCNDNNILHLQFDHINDDGNIERKGYNGTYELMRDYLNGRKDINKIQILCANCNYEKQYRKNYITVNVIKEITCGTFKI